MKHYKQYYIATDHAGHAEKVYWPDVARNVTSYYKTNLDGLFVFVDHRPPPDSHGLDVIYRGQYSYHNGKTSHIHYAVTIDALFDHAAVAWLDHLAVTKMVANDQGQYVPQKTVQWHYNNTIEAWWYEKEESKK